MGDDIRRKLILKQLDQANLAAGDEGEEENDLGELPSIKSNSMGSQKQSPNGTVPAGNGDETTWKQFFDHNERIKIRNRNLEFNTYYSLPNSINAPSIPIFILHHGAGSSGLTFATLAQQISSQLNGNCGYFTFDARGHGTTRPLEPSKGLQYDRQSYIDDFVELLEQFYSKHLTQLGAVKLSLVLVGHSLGGSICTFSHMQLPEHLRNKVLGVFMLDIVEEAAILALKNVHSFLSKTPNVFQSYQDAIDWSIRRGMSKNRSSAEIAVPACFHQMTSGKVVRITNLRDFEPYWDTWFVGLSERFVSLPTSKLLLLAGNENLDKELIIGQMQGKYQLVVFQDSGHFIQEDTPVKTAITLIDFWRRNDSKNIVIKTNWGAKNFTSQ
ncbi:hypothetical protein ZYGR_0N04540 [Zygosaccharomyces rouxii]|uniref:Protein phosphatase methylesterase 1 n=2 Tax=Zygosaccharomyces rouxii TaxID=4956 RepID=C5DVZ8_ZYGRC|nr:carboxylesterase-mitochondrial 37S ribosomal protein YmS2 [Zygosaccharomyces rouxii]KAH9200876.1 carboxylesterase-mitochondrial 37S ribosomal protein YmS2 [Zygosaccharomyces rouxii]GAV49049.1 hypothetical protein ZYGR_0N04540 [Zygosaccharomyces rouxii]CAR27967.1 ZYRO0D10692p [Zygosaccharomyces rouxii]